MGYRQIIGSNIMNHSAIGVPPLMETSKRMRNPGAQRDHAGIARRREVLLGRAEAKNRGESYERHWMRRVSGQWMSFLHVNKIQ